MKTPSVNIKCPICHGTMEWTSYEINTIPVGFPTDFEPGGSSVILNLVCSCGGTMCLQHPLRSGEVYIENGVGLFLGPKPAPKPWPDVYEVIAMKMSEVTFERTKNLGNFETERVGVTVKVENDDPKDCLREARRFVNKQLGFGPTDDEIEKARQILEEADEDEWTG